MSIDYTELTNRFMYHKPSTEDVVQRHEVVRAWADNFAFNLTTVCPESRELSLAITKVEEAMFWANAAVARHQ